MRRPSAGKVVPPSGHPNHFRDEFVRLLFYLSHVKFLHRFIGMFHALVHPDNLVGKGMDGMDRPDGMMCPAVGKTEMLSIDLSVIVIFVIVWVLVLVLSKVYFTPLRRIMGERDRRIQQDKDAAQDAMEKYGRVLEGIERDLAAAKSAARETREKWLREAQTEKEKMIDEVSRECRTQVQKAHKELNEKVESLKKELEPRSKNLAERIAKRILN